MVRPRLGRPLALHRLGPDHPGLHRHDRVRDQNVFAADRADATPAASRSRPRQLRWVLLRRLLAHLRPGRRPGAPPGLPRRSPLRFSRLADCWRGVPGAIMVSETRRRVLSISCTQTLTTSPTETTSCGSAHVAIGQLADMHQARVVQADVDKGPEVDHVQHGALQLHAGGQVVELDDPLLEDRSWQVLARVAPDAKAATQYLSATSRRR